MAATEGSVIIPGTERGLWLPAWMPRCLWRLRAREIIWAYDPEPLEALSAAMKIAFGLWLIDPGIHAFHVPGDGTTALGRMVPEPAWGVILVVLGIGQAAALFLGRINTQRAVALASAGVWAFIVGMFLFSDPRTAAIPFAVVLSLGQVWVYLSLGTRSRAGG